jgi:hypothetical protein
MEVAALNVVDVNVIEDAALKVIDDNEVRDDNEVLDDNEALDDSEVLDDKGSRVDASTDDGFSGASFSSSIQGNPKAGIGVSITTFDSFIVAGLVSGLGM